MIILTRMLILLTTVWTLRAHANALPNVTPSQADAMLDRYGPPGPTWPHFGDMQQSMIHGLKSGNERWLALLPRLRTGGSAAFNESLPIAVSEALKLRPMNVLRLLPVEYPVERICSDIEIEPSKAELKAYYAQTIPAVRAVEAPELRQVRDACFASLRHWDKYELANPG
jgi:hypothetical protein